MEQKKMLPLGIEDFEQVISNCYYVDKTMLLSEIVKYPTGTVLLYARPRRFGKSLALSMMDCFFSSFRKNHDLFRGLAISQDKEFCQTYQNQIPLIHLNLKNVTGSDEKGFLFKMGEAMASLYESFANLSHAAVLSERRKNYIQKILAQKASKDELSSSLRELCDDLCFCYGKRVMILIDEYDAPLQNAFTKGFYEDTVDFFKEFLGMALKGNPSLEKAVLTGIAQVAQASIFSGMNNLVANTVMSHSENEFFGFSAEEAKELFSYYGIAQDASSVRQWYGGYRFQGREILNPWSLLEFVKNQGFFQCYWVNTGSYDVIKRLLANGDETILRDVETLLACRSVESEIPFSLNYGELDGEAPFLSLLLQSGYLTAKPALAPGRYELSLPNREIVEVFRLEINDSYFKNGKSNRIESLKEAFLKGSEEEISKSIEENLLTSFSYYDFGQEKNYQIMILTMASLLFEECAIESEIPAGTGRCDILVSPKQKVGTGMVIEIKALKGKSSQSRIETTALSALRQIEEKQYDERLKKDAAAHLLLFGIAFHGKRVAVRKKIAR